MMSRVRFYTHPAVALVAGLLLACGVASCRKKPPLVTAPAGQAGSPPPSRVETDELEALRKLGVDHAMIWIMSRDEGALREIDELDMLKVLNKLLLRAGIANFIDPIVGAQPPPAPTAARPASGRGATTRARFLKKTFRRSWRCRPARKTASSWRFATG